MPDVEVPRGAFTGELPPGGDALPFPTQWQGRHVRVRYVYSPEQWSDPMLVERVTFDARGVPITLDVRRTDDGPVETVPWHTVAAVSHSAYEGHSATIGWVRS